ncbi:MAG: response regulator transcription factor [Candidatus Hinthialibacter sp.]
MEKSTYFQQISQKISSNEELIDFVQLALLGSLTRKVIHESNNQLTGIYGYLTLAQNTPSLPERIQTFLERSILCCESNQALNKTFAEFFHLGSKESFANSLVVDEVIRFCQKTLGPHFSIYAAADLSYEIAAPRLTVKLLFLFVLLFIEYTTRQRGEIYIKPKINLDSDKSPTIQFTINARSALGCCENRSVYLESGNLMNLMGEISYLMAQELAAQCGGAVLWRNNAAAIPGCQIILPLYTPSEPQKPVLDKKSPSVPKFTKSYRIFLLEDQPLIADFIENILHQEGHLVIVYHNGSEAASALSSRDILTIDLFLLDICVPGHSGLEVGRSIREKDSESRLLFYSALRSEKHVLEYFSLDKKTRFLQKPFRKDELFHLIESLMTTKE